MIILFLFFAFSSFPGASQRLTAINLKEIPQRKVRKYIVSRSIDQMDNFSSIHPSWRKGIDKSGFNLVEKIFNLKYKLSNVWECYRHVNPLETWNRQSIRFGLMISTSLNSVSYFNNTAFPEVDTGQVYFLNLRLLKGLFKVPVAFEIINIDSNLEILEFSYIENNKSRGKQTIQFFDNGDGTTRIVHSSYFKSDSRLRDKFLYPYFHKKFVREFHRNMKHLVQNMKPDAI